MSARGNLPEVGKPTAKAVNAARRKAVLAFLVIPVVLASALAFLLYLATNWPYPPGFEWVSRYAPRQLFMAGIAVAALLAFLCAVFVWRLAARWIWEPAARVLNAVESAGDEGGGPQADPPADLSQLYYRVERVAEARRSASGEARELDGIRASVEKLRGEIEQMGAGRFDRDFGEASGPLEPVGKSLAECCTELSGFMEGCAEVVEQISSTLRKAEGRAGELSARAENAFVGHSELLVGAKEFTKRVGEAVSVAALEARRGSEKDERGRDEALRGVSGALDGCAAPISGLGEKSGAGAGISADSRRLADEATVIALNAAIEASRSGSPDLEKLADSTRKLAEGAMEVSERVDSLSAEYLEAVKSATAALDDLRSELSAWQREARASESRRAVAASEMEQFLGSVGDMAAALADNVEKVAGLSEGASSEAQAARVAIDEALSEMESLKRRLGGRG